MTEFTTFWTAVSFLAAAICFSLAASVYRHARPSFEVNNVIVIALFLALRSVFFLMHELSGMAMAAADERTYYLLTNGAYLVQILVCAMIVYFIVLSTRQLTCDTGELADPSIFGIARWELLHKLMAAVVLGAAALVIAGHSYRMFWTLHTGAIGRGQPRIPSFPAAYIFGFLFGVGILVRMLGFGHAYRVRRGNQKGPQFSSSPNHDMHSRSGELRSWVISLLLMLDFSFDRSTQISGLGWLDVIWFLLPIAVILPLMYWKMRFIFFDVVIKRGLLLALLVATSGVYFYWCLLPLRRALSAENGPAGISILYMGGVLFTLLCVFSYGRMNRVLDRILFRRADYARLIPEIGSAIQQHVESQPLLAYLTGKLKRVLEAEAVTFRQPGPEGECALRADAGVKRKVERRSDTVMVAVKAGERLFGHLELGRRLGGQKYQSEDLAFLQRIADQLAGMLQNIDLRDERERQRNREQRLRELASQAELRALKAQINPHFLFNALNSLADLTRENPEAAEREILHLSEVFRYALAATQRESVKLGEEGEFLHSYLSVERIRFEDKLQFEMDIPEELRECRIPPMIIQPLVENAVKHGITSRTAGGRIWVSARLSGSNLRICVEDNGAGFDPQSTPSPGHNGIGLSNVRARIEALNAGSSLQVSSKPGHGTRISFELPVSVQDSAGRQE